VVNANPRLGVVGSHRLTREQSEAAWLLLSGALIFLAPGVVNTSTSTGVESVAAAVCNQMGWKEDNDLLVIHKPYNDIWTPNGKQDAYRRLIDNTDVLISIQRVGSYAGQWPVAVANDHGVEIYKYYL